MKAQKGTPHASINQLLNRAHEATEMAQKAGRKLPPAELRAALDAAIALTPVTAQETATPAPQATDFESLKKEWMQEHISKPRGRANHSLRLVIAGFGATLERFLHC